MSVSDTTARRDRRHGGAVERNGAAVADAGDGTSDAALLVRCRAGQTEAWDVLVDRYQKLVYSVAVRGGLSAEDAVDVAQNTFMILLESGLDLRQDESLGSWLMTVARRQSWRVRQRQRLELPAAEVVPLREDPTVDWEQALSLQSALHLLGSPCRELLTALYFDPAQPTYAQIARRFRRPIGGIGPMRGRCLHRLRDLLGDIEWT